MSPASYLYNRCKKSSLNSIGRGERGVLAKSWSCAPIIGTWYYLRNSSVFSSLCIWSPDQVGEFIISLWERMQREYHAFTLNFIIHSKQRISKACYKTKPIYLNLRGHCFHHLVHLQSLPTFVKYSIANKGKGESPETRRSCSLSILSCSPHV